MQNTFQMTETLAHGYSSESTPRELSNEYQYDRVSMIFKNLCINPSALDESSLSIVRVNWQPSPGLVGHNMSGTMPTMEPFNTIEACLINPYNNKTGVWSGEQKFPGVVINKS